jgi:hypothetical protein
LQKTALQDLHERFEAEGDELALLHRCVVEHCAQPREGRKVAKFHAEADAGAGKTFTANVAANTLRHAEKRVVCTAFTAKAACNYAAGVTCHAAFLLNRSDHREGTESRLISVARSGRGSLRDRLAVSRLQDAELIVIDECTMMRADEIDTISNGLQELGFTGALVVLGNFAQLGPVMPGANVGRAISQHITASKTLNSPDTKHIRLRSNVRMQHDLAFLNACNDIGYGRIAADDSEIAPDGRHKVTLDASVFHALPYDAEAEEGSADDSLTEARKFAHPTMFGERPYYDFAPNGKPSIIECPTRAIERAHNNFFLDRLGTSHCCFVPALIYILPTARRNCSTACAGNTAFCNKVCCHAVQTLCALMVAGMSLQ